MVSMAKKIGGGFGPSLLPKKILGCGAHPQTHFRPPENSVVGVFLGENRDFYKFLPMSPKYQGGSPRYLTGLGRHIDPKKPFAPQEVCVHTRHTLSETSKKNHFFGPQKGNILTKKSLFVPYGCKYSFGAHQIVLAEKFGARR